MTQGNAFVVSLRSRNRSNTAVGLGRFDILRLGKLQWQNQRIQRSHWIRSMQLIEGLVHNPPNSPVFIAGIIARHLWCLSAIAALTATQKTHKSLICFVPQALFVHITRTGPRCPSSMLRSSHHAWHEINHSHTEICVLPNLPTAIILCPIYWITSMIFVIVG